MKSTNRLKADHALILLGLRVLDAMQHEMKSGENVSRKDIRSLLTFLREFADGCHHVKEEAVFFPALILAGLSPTDGPLSVIANEHEFGRALAQAMQEAVDQHHTNEFVRLAAEYIQLLREHIEKENWVLFDVADQVLSDEEDDSIAETFESFAPLDDRMRSLIEELALKYCTQVVV